MGKFVVDRDDSRDYRNSDRGILGEVDLLPIDSYLPENRDLRLSCSKPTGHHGNRFLRSHQPNFRQFAMLAGVLIASLIFLVPSTPLVAKTPAIAVSAPQQRSGIGGIGTPAGMPGSGFSNRQRPTFPSSNMPSTRFPGMDTGIPGGPSTGRYVYYCTNCNAEVSKNANRCRACGIRLVGFTNQSSGSNRFSGSGSQLAVGFLVILVGGLIGLSLFVGAIALVVKVATSGKKKPKYVSNWRGGSGVNPTVVPTNQGGGMYQKDAQKRWGLAQVPKSISGAPDARTQNLGYAQGIARRPGFQPQPGQYPQGQLQPPQPPMGQRPVGQRPPVPPPSVQRPPANYPQGQAPSPNTGVPMGRPAGYPSGQAPPAGQRPIYGRPAGHPGQGPSSNQRPGGPPSGHGRR